MRDPVTIGRATLYLGDCRMNRLRSHYNTRPDNRAGELDPSTFDYPEDFQREPRDGRWILAGYGSALLIGVGFWAGILKIAGVW